MARRRRRKKPARFSNMVIVSLIVAMIVVVVLVGSSGLKERKAAYQKREEYLLEQIEIQDARAVEIAEYEKYTHTKQYIEDMAKSKLGLVYKDEIIFEANN